MSKPFDDAVYLDHILDYIAEVEAILATGCRDRIHELAAIRAVEVIGEAANNLTPALRNANAHVSWRDIVDMRNLLIHGYFEVEAQELWSVCERDVPVLKEAILRIKKELS